MAEKGPDAVDTRRTGHAAVGGAVVDVDRAVLARPPVHADARVIPARVPARRPVLADLRVQGALVDVLGTTTQILPYCVFQTTTSR